MMLRRLFQRVALTAALIVPVLLSASIASAQIAPDQVQKEKQTKLNLYLSAKQAAEIVEKEKGKVLFVDVRTRAEMQFVGWAPAIHGHIPFVDVTEFWDWDDKAARFKLDSNPTFSQDMERLLKKANLTKSDKIILMCRSGDRSARAINALAEAGFTNVWNQIEGFEGDMSKAGRREVNGWKNAGLPWTYKLEKDKIYLKQN